MVIDICEARHEARDSHMYLTCALTGSKFRLAQ